MSDWINAPTNPKDHYGFVYQITNLKTGMKYIGQKTMTKDHKLKITKKMRREQGLDNRKTYYYVKRETDWKDYWSSSDLLKKEVQKLGEHNFKREILCVCDSKAELRYMEAKIQMELDVVLRDDYYNNMVNLRLGGPGLAPVKKKYLNK